MCSQKNNQQKNNDLLSGIAIYSIGSVGSKILSFLLVPLYTYYISAQDMGIYDLLHTTIGLLTPIITMQISDAAFRWMVREPENKECYVRATLQVLCINCCVASVLIWGIGHFIAIPYQVYFILSLITARFLATVQKLLRGLKNQRLFASSGVLYTLVYLLSNILLICVLRKGIESLFVSTIIADIVAICVIFLCEKRLRINLLRVPQMSLIQKMIVFSAPLVPNQLNWWIINSSDRYVIQFFLGTMSNGIYAIAYKFPTALQIVLNLFNNSWQDVSVGDTEKDTENYYSGVFRKLYQLSFSLLWMLIPATKLFILYTMNSSYHDAAKYVSFLYLGTVFQSFSSFYGVGYLKNRNTKQASLTSIYGAVVNAVANILLVQFIGLHAASISTFLGFTVMWIIRERQNHDELGVVIEPQKFLPLFLITFALSVVSCFSDVLVDTMAFLGGVIAFIVLNYRTLMSITTWLLKKIRVKRK